MELNDFSFIVYSVLGSVGEPINPEAWMWYYKKIGNSRCSIVDTFWQTETGGHVITPLPGATNMKPGSAVCTNSRLYSANHCLKLRFVVATAVVVAYENVI